MRTVGFFTLGSVMILVGCERDAERCRPHCTVEIQIANGAEYSTTDRVLVSIVAQHNPNLMMVSGNPNFVGARWQDYESQLEGLMPEGRSSLFVKVRGGSRES